MLSTPNSKQHDDPHDILAVEPHVAVIAPSDEELSKLAHMMRHPSSPQLPSSESDAPAEWLPAASLPADIKAPPVDATFRPSISDVAVARPAPSSGARALRTFTATLLLAVCAGGAAVAWQTHGEAAKQIAARWVPQRVFTSLLTLEKLVFSAQTAPPAVETAAAPPQPTPPAQAAPEGVAPAVVNTATAKGAPPQPVPPAQTAPEGVAPTAAVPSAGPPQSPGSTARDFASVQQEIAELKASIEELKANQQQMAREIAKSAERSSERLSNRPSAQDISPRTVPSRVSASPPRTTVARAHKPMMPPVSPPLAAAAPPLPQTAAPSVPRQSEPPPQIAAPPQADPEVASAPRPPAPIN